MSIQLQIYKEFGTNKHYTLMKTIFFTDELFNKFSGSGQRMINHLFFNLSTGKTYTESQTIELKYKHFITKKILSKNMFYKAIQELINAKIIYKTDDLFSRDHYHVNYYYINAMNANQWKEFLNDFKIYRQQELSNSLFNIFDNKSVSDNDLISYEQLIKDLKNPRYD